MAQTVTFVQLTDPHLYDAGSQLPPQGARAEFLDNRSALDWAILQINQLQTSTRCIDFVAITGDFGLDVPDSRPAPAVDDIARSLAALQVKLILVVPGNNDLVNEKPRDIPRFRAFIKDLQARLPDNRLVDLTQTTEIVNTIRILGLNSASFKNDSGKEKGVNRDEQLAEMNRLAKELVPNQTHIIFTHIPDVEDPYRGPTGQDIHAAWQVHDDVKRKWREIISSREVVAVFAGHLHDARRNLYSQDYNWANAKPDTVTAAKTWVAPPLAVKFQDRAAPQARGFVLATVSSSGKVIATPFWYGDPAGAPLPDKASNLTEANEAAADRDWQKAADAYSVAMGSSNLSVRTEAKLGYVRSREQMRSMWWNQELLRSISQYFRHKWAEFALKLVLIGLLTIFVAHLIKLVRDLLDASYRSKGPPVILAPSKYTPDAPSELFAAEMMAAAEELRATFAAASASPYATSFEHGMTLHLPSQTFQQAIDAIPNVKDVNLGKIATFFLSIFRYCQWHVESGIGVSNNQAVGIAFLRWRSEIRMVWRASRDISSPLDIVTISRELAYNILGLPFVGGL